MDTTNGVIGLFRSLERRTKVLLALGLIAAIAAGGVFLYVRTEQNQKAAAYDARMRAGLEGMPSLDFMKGNALVAYNDTEGRYVDQYIYDALKPGDPAQVRGVVHFTYGQVRVGTYSTGGGGAYQRTIDIGIFDAVTGRMFPNAYTTILGGDPPRTVSGPGISDQYGPYPDEYEVRRWVEKEWNRLAYHRMMREGFAYGQPHSLGFGDKLVMLDMGEFTTKYLPAGLTAATPEEVGAIVRRDAKDGYGLDASGKNFIEWTDHTLTFISLLTGEPIEGLETTFRSSPSVKNQSNAALLARVSVRSWEDTQRMISKWIEDTWTAYRQR